MMHFLTVYSTQGKNSLQKFLVAEADKWKCILVDDDLGPDGEAKRACIEHFRKMLDTANQQFPKCTPCKFATGEDHIAFQTPDGLGMESSTGAHKSDRQPIGPLGWARPS